MNCVAWFALMGDIAYFLRSSRCVLCVQVVRWGGGAVGRASVSGSRDDGEQPEPIVALAAGDRRVDHSIESRRVRAAGLLISTAAPVVFFLVVQRFFLHGQGVGRPVKG